MLNCQPFAASYYFLLTSVPMTAKSHFDSSSGSVLKVKSIEGTPTVASSCAFALKPSKQAGRKQARLHGGERGIRESPGAHLIVLMWWPGTELNRRRQPFQGCALPPELPGHALDDGLAAESVRVVGTPTFRRSCRQSRTVKTLGASGTARL